VISSRGHKQMLNVPHRLAIGFVIASSLASLSLAQGQEPNIPENESAPVEAMSLFGKPLSRPAIPGERLAKLTEDLEKAHARFIAAPDSEEAAIWYGRRLAYLGRYQAAVANFTDALKKHPRSYRLLRHRGHRFITLRKFPAAIADLSLAAELSRDAADALEPDGVPNAINQPLSTDKFNIWYHLALAHYLSGDYTAAIEAWKVCREHSVNPDLQVATADWTYMTLRRLGRHEEARAVLEPFSEKTEVVENDAYLKRLLMYKGLLTPDALLALPESGDADPVLTMATQGYGVANYFLAEGNEARATEIFGKILESPNWAPFGYIAAEADLARIKQAPRGGLNEQQRDHHPSGDDR
jgi:tetratricopeptide (TPR) repeat protein